MINVGECFLECDHAECSAQLGLRDLVEGASEHEPGELNLVAARARQRDAGWVRLPIRDHTTFDLCPKHLHSP